MSARFVLRGVVRTHRLVAVPSREHGPGDASELVGERDGQDVAMQPTRRRLNPGPQARPRPVWAARQDNMGRLHE